MFKFKQFTIQQDKCAMKVGTDGVLLGAWANCKKASSVLDIGTGTGLIALMIAQRNTTCQITAIDINEEAITQAQENVDNSPWNDRITLIHSDFKTIKDQKKYDLIVSNPPFFENSLICEDNKRTLARHTTEFSYDDFFAFAEKHLNKNGILSMVIPTEIFANCLILAQKYDFLLIRRTNVLPTPNKPTKRLLLEFSQDYQPTVQSDLIIETARHQYTEDFKALTKEFYLD